MVDYLTHTYPLVRKTDPDEVRSVSSFVSTSCAIGYHDTTHSPIGLWQFSGSLEDSSGYGNTLQVNAGSFTYTELIKGIKGIIFGGASSLKLPSGTGNFYQLGDLTIEAIVSVLVQGHATLGFGSGFLVSHTVSTPLSESPATNVIYSLTFQGDANQFTWHSEHGSGVNDTFASANGINIGQAHHIAAVRSSNFIKFFLNGSTTGLTGSLTAPDGGTSGTLFVGIGPGTGGSNGILTACVASLKIIPSALTDAEVLAEYNRTLGARYPVRSATDTPST